MPHTSHINVFAEAISISFTTDFATSPIESTEEETIQPLHSSTPQPSLQTTNDSMEGSSSSYMTADTVTQISDVTVQGNMIHAPKQFFLQLLSHYFFQVGATSTKHIIFPKTELFRAKQRAGLHKFLKCLGFTS